MEETLIEAVSSGLTECTLRTLLDCSPMEVFPALMLLAVGVVAILVILRAQRLTQ